MHAKRGKRIERGENVFRSRWEANLALIFDLWKDKPLSPSKNVLLDWEYEPETFDLRPWYRDGAPDYTPDFKLVWADNAVEWVECKGFSQGRDRNQMRRWMRHYGSRNLTVVTDDKKTIAFIESEGLGWWSYRNLERQYKHFLDGWL